MRHRSESGPISSWYKDAIIYQLHVRAFYDSNDDGVGDFPGLIERLDYLCDLGVTAVWLLPFYPSPLKDDGYDISDYTRIHPAYGTLSDFRRFLDEAHARGLRVITELVINHTSDQHEWFQRARRAPRGSKWRDFYVWSDDPQRYKGVRIIFKDFETSNWSWDPVAKSYYWHRFFSHQPDLNFDHPDVQDAVFETLDFWFKMGVDGLRLDAVPYLFEREGTSCENLPETHEFLKKLRLHVSQKYPQGMLLAEANQWPEDAVAYFGDGDECHMNFHFPLMPRLFMALKMEDRYSIIDILNQTPAIPEECQWATFLRNHDELTLEMVTDEERDYMYKVYASDPRAKINLGLRRRLAPLMENDRRQIELLNALLFSLPGSPIIYYGDEIGMGDNIYLGDRDGVRTPLQWSPDRNAGFSRASPQKLYLPVIQSSEYLAETVNVETQQANPNSMYWWMRRLIAMRKQHPELSRGTLEFVESSNSKVLSFTRTHIPEADRSMTEAVHRTLLCVANLSRSIQPVELDLLKFRGKGLVEAFAGQEFPPVGEGHYFLSLAAYSFMWFQIIHRSEIGISPTPLRDSTPLAIAREPLEALAERAVWKDFESGLFLYLSKARWYAGKDRSMSGAELVDLIPLRHEPASGQSALAILKVFFKEGLPESYLIMLSYAEGDRAKRLRESHPDSIIARYNRSENTAQSFGIYYDAALDGGLSRALLFFLLRGGTLKGRSGVLEVERIFNLSQEEMDSIPDPLIMGGEQSNSSFLFSKHFFLKIYRRIEEGENPEIEVGRYLTEKGLDVSAPFVGALTYRRGSRNYSIAIAERAVTSETDAWNLFGDHARRFREIALAELPSSTMKSETPTPWEPFGRHPSLGLVELSGYSFELARELGRTTAAMHIALCDEDGNSAFVPEPFTPFQQRSLFQSLRNLILRTLQELKTSLPRLIGEAKDLAAHAITCEVRALSLLAILRRESIDAPRIRIHGDLQLRQVLFTGTHFRIIDFEGEPLRGIDERRLKRSPLKDIAGMLRSFQYIVEFEMKSKPESGESSYLLRNAMVGWANWVGSEYFNAYLSAMESSTLLPPVSTHISSLLRIFLLEKAFYEVRYELRFRPTWLEIPLRGLFQILDESPP
jgi:maltose alpha-D-glucosyltransferase/alpha-amylase